MENRKDSNSSKNMYLFVPILIGLGFLTNHFNVPLFFSVSMIFGSIFALAGLLLYGRTVGVIIGIIVSTYTYVLWGHPYAIVIFSCEILFVALLRHRIQMIAFADFLYWILIGIPLVFIFYQGVLDLGFNASALIALKQFINGVFNAVIASLAVSVGRIMFQRSGEIKHQFSAKHMVTSFLTLLTITAGAVPIIVNGHRIKAMQEENLLQQMLDYQTVIVNEILSTQESTDLSNKSRSEASPKPADIDVQFGNLSALVTFKDDRPALILGELNKHTNENGVVTKLTGGLNIWNPPGDMSAMMRWAKSEYFIRTTPPTKTGVKEIVISAQTAPIANVLYKVRTHTLISLAILVSLALAIAYILGRILISPIQRLADASQTVADLAGENVSLKFPRSAIVEYDDLSLALQKSSNSMQEYITALQEMKDTLEQRVKARTEELARLSMVASQTINGVIITDANGRVEWINEGFTRISGYTLEDMKGKKPGHLLQGENTSKRTSRRISEALRTKRAFSDEILNYTKDGDEIWLQISVNPLTDDEGNVTGFIGIETDVTERRMDRLKLIQARIEAEKSNEAKSTFLSTMSHEIRTPLNGIMGMAQLLQDTKLDEHQESFLRTILTSSDNLLAIINDILDMSKIEAGAMEIERTDFDLPELVSTTLSPLQTQARKKNLRLLSSLPTDDTQYLIGDPVRIRQILTNLVSNAIKFTEKGSVTVDMNLGPNDPSLPIPHERVLELQVKDTGVGIAEDRLKDIFTPFTQEDNTITRKFGGTGLGLSIVSKLVELMGGTISVNSKPQEGTIFAVRIPVDLVQDTEKPRDEAKTHSSLPKSLRIIVAEDNPVNAVIVKSFLLKVGCDVIVAENGALAVEEVEKQIPDLIFMDAHMPIMDGIAATKAIKSNKKAQNVPIIGLTADAFEENRQKFLNAGMDDVLTKPFKEDQILSILERHTGEGSVMSNPGPQDTTQDELPIGDDKEIEGLQNQIGEVAMQSMLSIAPDSFLQQVRDMEAAITNEDATMILEAAHALKGAAGAMYSYRLAAEAAVIEKNASDLALVKERFPALQNTVEQTIEWLQKKQA